MSQWQCFNRESLYSIVSLEIVFSFNALTGLFYLYGAPLMHKVQEPCKLWMDQVLEEGWQQWQVHTAPQTDHTMKKWLALITSIHIYIYITSVITRATSFTVDKQLALLSSYTCKHEDLLWSSHCHGFFHCFGMSPHSLVHEQQTRATSSFINNTQSVKQIVADGDNFHSFGPWAVNIEPTTCNGHLPNLSGWH